jgi:hypothetical protein
MAKTEKHPHRSGFCMTGHCDNCPHAFSVTRRDGQGEYSKEWTCECMCHTERGLPW